MRAGWNIAARGHPQEARGPLARGLPGGAQGRQYSNPARIWGYRTIIPVNRWVLWCTGQNFPVLTGQNYPVLTGFI